MAVPQINPSGNGSASRSSELFGLIGSLLLASRVLPGGPLAARFAAQKIFKLPSETKNRVFIPSLHVIECGKYTLMDEEKVERLSDSFKAFKSSLEESKEKIEDNKQYQRNWFIYPAMVFVGFYGGFIQAGVGFLLMASLYHLMRLDLVYVNMHKIFIVFIYTIPALLIFFLTHNVDFKFGMTLAAGNAFGAWWSAKFSVKKGEGLIRIILMVAIFIMSMKLLDII